MPEISTPVSSRVFYRKVGSGPVIVLLHGFPLSGLLWKNVWEELSRSYTVIVPDFPGSGNSLLEKETSIADMAECVHAIMEHERIGKAVIAGHSMGGYVAFAFAGMYPEKVMGLSLVHSIPLADDEEKVKTRLKSIALIQKGGKETFISQMIPNLFSASFKLSNPLTVKEQVDEAMKTDEAGMVNFYQAMIGRKDTTYVLDKATFPVQWIIGSDDNVIYFKKILEQCYKSNINFVTFYHNCGHMSMIEAPERLISDFRIFIDQCNFYNKP